MKFLVMLEDDQDRIQRFRTIVARHHPDAKLGITRTAADFITAYQSLTETPELICLDHDLFPDSFDDPDPGDGREVATFLTTQPVKCPVLIHSTNAHVADAMMFSLRDANWKAYRITPLGDDWIESDWFPVASKLIAQRNIPTSRPA